MGYGARSRPALASAPGRVPPSRHYPWSVTGPVIARGPRGDAAVSQAVYRAAHNEHASQPAEPLGPWCRHLSGRVGGCTVSVRGQPSGCRTSTVLASAWVRTRAAGPEDQGCGQSANRLRHRLQLALESVAREPLLSGLEGFRGGFCADARRHDAYKILSSWCFLLPLPLRLSFTRNAGPQLVASVGSPSCLFVLRGQLPRSVTTADGECGCA